ncbi:hypothetical protein OIU77_021208 [Salix suchowensis]|uniref:DUF295 domain-containing protein n=1 Tax=Salix suchowensis TaxID=1278906 RepID=A0ABQ9CCC6_9ROSI|nr:hypothetical protein OIU77_021208 [Salix suchowensis]
MDGGGEYLEVFLEALTISSLFWIPLRQMLNVSSDPYTSRLYLVESSGRVLLVVRRKGEFVDEEGRVLHEGDLLTDIAIWLDVKRTLFTLLMITGSERTNENYLYGGHEMGVYSLKDKSAKHFYQLDALKIQPPPCWLLPNPW